MLGRLAIGILLALPLTVQASEVPWGESVQGVQVRLRADKTTWAFGEVPELKTDVRIVRDYDLRVTRAQESCEFELNGQWHSWQDGPTDVKSSSFPPG